MEHKPYQLLAERLDQLPQGFPPSPDGLELALLAKLFTPEEAELASHLRITPQTAEQIAEKTGGDPKVHRKMLKGMARRGLIGVGKTGSGLDYHLIPFVVGIYENQGDSIDLEMALMFEKYYLQVMGAALAQQPTLHRVIPVYESVPRGGDIQPYESVLDIINKGQSWGVIDCICRKQKALIGEACQHPVDVCMQISPTPGAFEEASWIKELTHDEALEVLKKAAEAGLVHTVNNSKKDVWYICNCCTCSCGILRGIVDLGLASVAAHSGFINRVDDDLCILCGECVDHCPFLAIQLEDRLVIDAVRCAGCGVCNAFCPQNALHLFPRPENELMETPETTEEWRQMRAHARGQNLEDIL